MHTQYIYILCLVSLLLDLHGFTTLGNLGIARAFSPPLWSPTWKPWLKADQLALRRTHPKSARNAMIWADAGFASEVGKDPTCKNCLVVGSWSSMCKYVVSCNQGISGVFMDQYPGLSDYPGLSENRVPKNPCSRSKLTFWEVNPPFSNRPIWSKRLPQNPQSACTLTKLMTMRYSPGAGLHGPILYEMVMVVANCGGFPPRRYRISKCAEEPGKHRASLNEHCCTNVFLSRTNYQQEEWQ